MIEKIENILIIISRYFLIIIGSLALIGAVFMLLYSITLIIDSPNTSPGKLPKITYDNTYKSELFPKPKQQLESLSTNSISKSTQDQETQQPVDKRYIELHSSMSKQFNDSQDNINKFFAKITPRILEQFFEDNYKYLGLKDFDILVTGLTTFYDEISNISDFKRIGDFDSRYNLVLESLEMYFDDFKENLASRQAQIDRNISKSAANNAKGYANLINVLYGLALYAAAVLYLMIFKVEINLRRIPTAIKDEN